MLNEKAIIIDYKKSTISEKLLKRSHHFFFQIPFLTRFTTAFRSKLDKRDSTNFTFANLMD